MASFVFHLMLLYLIFLFTTIDCYFTIFYYVFECTMNVTMKHVDYFYTFIRRNARDTCKRGNIYNNPLFDFCKL